MFIVSSLLLTVLGLALIILSLFRSHRANGGGRPSRLLFALRYIGLAAIVAGIVMLALLLSGRLVLPLQYS